MVPPSPATSTSRLARVALRAWSDRFLLQELFEALRAPALLIEEL